MTNDPTSQPANEPSADAHDRHAHRSVVPQPPSARPEYVQVGASGLFVYRVGLGAMQFGWSVDETGAFEILDAYAGQGGNFIDTADVYSAWASSMGGPSNPGGVSEEIIGRWLSARGNRDEMVIATKVRGAMGEMFSQGRQTRHGREGLSRRWIMNACDDSLRRLAIDHIDLYQVHWIDPLVPIEETLSALNDLVRVGKVRYVGCSNFSAWRLIEALWASDRNGLESFISVQPEYSLLDPTRSDVEMELAPACVRHGIGMIPYSPLGGGVLTGKYRRGQTLPDSVRADENAERRFSERNFDIVDVVVDIAHQLDVSPASVAVNWVMSRPGVASPLLGANSPQQLLSTMQGLDTVLPDAALQRLNEASAFRRHRPSLEE